MNKILTALFFFFLIGLAFVPSVAATFTQTNYFRSDSGTYNGLTANLLLTTNTVSAATTTRTHTDTGCAGATQYTIGIKVYIRHADTTETLLSGSNPVAQVIFMGATATQTGTWSAPTHALVLTDSIVVRIYGEFDTESSFSLSGSPNVWQDTNILSYNLVAATWSVKYWGSFGCTNNKDTGTFRFGDTSANHADSQINNMVFGSTTNLGFAESYTISDALNRRAAKAFTEAVSISDMIGRALLKAFSEALSVTDTLKNGIGKTLSEALGVVDTLQNAIGKAFAETVTFGESLTYVFVHAAVLAKIYPYDYRAVIGIVIILIIGLAFLVVRRRRE